MGKTKSFCQDMTEGKFNFPIIHAIQSGHPESGKVLNIVKQRTDDIDLKRFCLSLIKEIGSLAYTKKKLEKLEEEIREEIKNLGGNPLLEKFLTELVSIVPDQ